MNNSCEESNGSGFCISGCLSRVGSLLFIAALTLLGGCSSGDSGVLAPAASNQTTTSGASEISTAVSSNLSGQLGSPMISFGGVMELSFSGIGANHPSTEAKWVVPPASLKTVAATSPLPNFIDVAALPTSSIGGGGFRYVAATLNQYNTGSSFAAGIFVPAGFAPSSVAPADVNGDGKLDVFVTDPTIDRIQMLLGL